MISPATSCHPRWGIEASAVTLRSRRLSSCQSRSPSKSLYRLPFCTLPFPLGLWCQSRAHSVLPNRCMNSGLGDSLSLARRPCLLGQGPGHPQEHPKGPPGANPYRKVHNKENNRCLNSAGFRWEAIFSTADERDAPS